MSWEWDEREIPCPCGKGTILIRSGSDDWCQHDETQEMKCSRCRDRYVLVTRGHGRFDESLAWIPREEHERQEAAQAAEERRQDALTTKARARLGTALVAALSRYTSRKAVWDVLGAAGCTSSSVWSFAAFNRLVREKGRDEAIRRMIDWRNQGAVKKLITRPRR